MTDQAADVDPAEARLGPVAVAAAEALAAAAPPLTDRMRADLAAILRRPTAVDDTDAA